MADYEGQATGVIPIEGTGAGISEIQGQAVGVIPIEGAGTGISGRQGASIVSLRLKEASLSVSDLSRCLVTTYFQGRMVVPNSG